MCIATKHTQRKQNQSALLECSEAKKPSTCLDKPNQKKRPRPSSQPTRTKSTLKPNIMDFAKAIGEKSSKIDIDLVEKYSDRSLLKLSAEWSNFVYATSSANNKNNNKSTSTSDIQFNRDLEIIIESLSLACASREVAGVCLLAEMETRAQPQPTSWHLFEDEDDGITEEVVAEIEAASIIRQEIRSLEMGEEKQKKKLVEATNASRLSKLNMIEKSSRAIFGKGIETYMIPTRLI